MRPGMIAEFVPGGNDAGSAFGFEAHFCPREEESCLDAKPVKDGKYTVGGRARAIVEGQCHGSFSGGDVVVVSARPLPVYKVGNMQQNGLRQSDSNQDDQYKK